MATDEIHFHFERNKSIKSNYLKPSGTCAQITMENNEEIISKNMKKSMLDEWSGGHEQEACHGGTGRKMGLGKCRRPVCVCVCARESTRK